jgi:DNA-binding CsgD family transcriptional regulator
MKGPARISGELGVTRWSVGGNALALVDLPPMGDLYRALCDGHGLTEAEVAVGALVLRGLGNDAIAAARATSPRTVRNQLSSLFRKLGVGSRTELAARHGWVAGRPDARTRAR